MSPDVLSAISPAVQRVNATRAGEVRTKRVSFRGILQLIRTTSSGDGGDRTDRDPDRRHQERDPSPIEPPAEPRPAMRPAEDERATRTCCKPNCSNNRGGKHDL